MHSQTVPPYVALGVAAALVKELDPIRSGQSSAREAVTRARGTMEPILADGLRQLK